MTAWIKEDLQRVRRLMYFLADEGVNFSYTVNKWGHVFTFRKFHLSDSLRSQLERLSDKWGIGSIYNLVPDYGETK